MTTYAIGDIQGCYFELLELLEKIRFDPRRDQIWFTGDIVNRGPNSLETVRFIKALGDAAVTVLGNHDLHLLSVAAGASKPKHKDTFGDILGAPDRDELLDWLRQRPLLHGNGEFYLLHAGLPPQWDMETASRCAHEVEQVLRSEQFADFFAHMYGDMPAQWSEDLRDWERCRFITNCLTRIRYCDLEGRLDLKEKCQPGRQASTLFPWFKVPGRRSESAKIIFGHWSSLGFYAENGCWCLDTGCLWGGELSALPLAETAERISVPCQRRRKPKT